MAESREENFQAVKRASDTQNRGGGVSPSSRDGNQNVGNKRAVSFEDAMNEALRLYEVGNFDAAERICTTLINHNPKSSAVHNLMGVILHSQGKTAEAVKKLQRAIHLNDQNPQYFSNLGEFERRRGKLDEATRALNRALTLDPKSIMALNNLGIVLYDKRNYEKAIEYYQKAIALDGGKPETHNNIGNALRALKKNDEALEHYQQALLLRNNYPEAYNNSGTVLRYQGKFPEAEHSYRRAIAIDGKYSEAYVNLAAMLSDLDRDDEALRILGTALEKNKNHFRTLSQVARIQLKLGNHALALRAAEMAIKIMPDNSEARILCGRIYHELDRFSAATESFEHAIRLNPNSTDARNMRGLCLKALGRVEEARDEFHKALELSPDSYGTFSNLVDMERYTAESPVFQKMQQIIEDAKDATTNRYIPIHFALGKAYDDMGEYKKAIKHFEVGAKLKRQQLEYDEEDMFGFFDSIIETFNLEYFENKPYSGNPSKMPIFIVGMPRSGSTLVEQVLSAHPKVTGLGEVKEFSRQLSALRGRFPALPQFPESIAKMRPEHFGLLADGYLSNVSIDCDPTGKFTDKLLTNYYFVGLLNTLFPNAKFIYTKRNAADTCLSTFTKLFKDDMPHSYDLGELGRYYKKCDELMAHWIKVLSPNTIKTIEYEDMVQNVEKHARSMVDFVGLEWDNNCLEFHDSTRPVKTASVLQVRQPVYQSSVDRYKRYGNSLNPLLEALGVRIERVAKRPKKGKVE